MRRIEQCKRAHCTASQFDVGQLFLTFKEACSLLLFWWKMRVIMVLVDRHHYGRGIDQEHR